MHTLINNLAEQFNIPTIDKNKKIWFIRTKSGIFYQDYRINNFVALGWNKIDANFIRSKKLTWNQKKEKISEIYPEEKRPGLILGQMNSFYVKMSPGDLVLIPSEGGKQIAIGVLGNLIDTVHRKTELANDYPICQYLHIREVKWVKEIDLHQDIYLFRELRAHQTISDISSCADLIYRNLFSTYITENTIHLTIQKITSSELNIIDNFNLCSSIMKINENINDLYGYNNTKKSINIKTAVGSPGFFEIIMSEPDIAKIATVVILSKAIIGKAKNSGDKTTATGILAIINTINTLINDRQNRKKISAETKKTEAETQKIIVETKLLEKQLNIPTQDKISQSVKLIETSYEELSKTANSAGLVCDEIQPTDIAG